jgi:hypothetical protein
METVVAVAIGAALVPVHAIANARRGASRRKVDETLLLVLEGVDAVPRVRAIA